MATPLILDYAPRKEFEPFHERRERFACIVTHRRAGKTVACVQELQRAAMQSRNVRPRFAYLAPFQKLAKAVAWDYLRAAMASVRPLGATVHESELRVDYTNGAQVRLYGTDNPDAMRGIYLDGIVLDEYADMDPARLVGDHPARALADRARMIRRSVSGSPRRSEVSARAADKFTQSAQA
jgi:phage terminase large subunit